MLRKLLCSLALCCALGVAVLGAAFADTAYASTLSLNDATTGTATNQFEFGGSWTAGADWRAYQGDEHYSNLAGNYAQVRFSGTQVQVYTTIDPRHGIMAISIDGGAETFIDTYWPWRVNQELKYTSPVFPDGPHTLRVRVTGAENADAADSYIVVDRIDVDSSAAATATAVDHAHIRLDWAAVSGAASYRVSRGALAVGTTTDTTFTDTLLWAQSSYAYRVEALSASGATLSAVSGSAATSVLPAGGFPRPFAANGVWNKPIGAAPLHPRSAALAAFFASHAINPNLTFYSYGVSVSETRPSDPLQSVPCIRYVNCTLGAFGSFRIPTTAQADPSSDGHLAIYDPVAGREWDMWQAWKSGDSWSAGAGAAVSMSGDGIAAANTASGNAANFPLLGGIVRPEELLQGRIDHALVFMMPQVSNLGRVCPATHSVGDTSHPDALKQGTRIQLDPGLNVDSLAIPAWQKTIGRALQVYGAYLRDSSSSLAIIGENPISRGYDAWALVGLGEPNDGLMRGFPWDRFRVLDAATTC